MSIAKGRYSLVGCGEGVFDGMCTRDFSLVSCSVRAWTWCCDGEAGR